MTKGRTTVIQRDPNKGTTQNNYRPITCYNDIEKNNSTNKRRNLLLTNKLQFVPWRRERMLQRIHRHSRITVHRSTYSKLEKDRMEKTTRNDYKKAYDMDPHSWIINSLKMYKISHEVINFIDKTVKTWRVELTAGGRSLAETKIQRGVFQGNALSPLLFIITMMPHNHILRKCTAGYKLSRSQEKINHLMSMDDIKLFGKIKKNWKL